MNEEHPSLETASEVDAAGLVSASVPASKTIADFMPEHARKVFEIEREVGNECDKHLLRTAGIIFLIVAVGMWMMVWTAFQDQIQDFVFWPFGVSIVGSAVITFIVMILVCGVMEVVKFGKVESRGDPAGLEVLSTYKINIDVVNHAINTRFTLETDALEFMERVNMYMLWLAKKAIRAEMKAPGSETEFIEKMQRLHLDAGLLVPEPDRYLQGARRIVQDEQQLIRNEGNDQQVSAWYERNGFVAAA